MTVDPCDRCQQPHVTRTGHPACTGHVIYDRASYVKGQNRQRLEQPRPCRKSPVVGAAVCDSHGGKAAQVKAAAQQRDTERKAANVMRRFGEPVDTTPADALLDTVKWTAGYVTWLRDKVAKATDDADLTQRSTLSGKSEASVWVDLLGTWHDRLVRICSEAIRCGIEERRVRLAESQGKLLADVIRSILADLKLTAEQEAMVSVVVPRHLRAVAS